MRKKPFIIILGTALLLGFLLVCSGVYVSKSAFSNPARRIEQPVQEKQHLPGEIGFGQFPPSTDAERELEKALQGVDRDIDLALANWLIVADIPEFSDMTREAYFAQLNAMTEQVRRDMNKMQAAGYAGTDPNNPQTLCQRFCSAIIGLHFSYVEEFRAENLTAAQMAKLYADPGDIFLAGLLRTRQGSCVSMPLIYLVIGQRLGMPVHLVAIGKHYFIRWQEPGYRMNIETTSVEKIAMTDNDSVYLEAEGISSNQISGSDLRNLSNREVVGELFYIRSSYWHDKGEEFEAWSRDALVHAHELAPDDPAIKNLFQKVFGTR